VLERLPHIAFTGKAGAGKSTAASALVDHLGYRLVSFAAPLKNAAALIWGPEARTDRSLLQWLGQIIRERDEFAWVDAAIRQIDDEFNNSPHVTGHAPRIVIDDLRFPNEYHRLKEEGFVIVRVEANRHSRIDRLKANGKLQDEAQLEDTSETALDSYEADYTIVNDGTPEELAEQIRVILGREAARV
jgi:dephospho-CoA kinase